MCSFLSLSPRVTPRMALRQRILNTSNMRVSLALRVHVSDAYVAMGTIRALHMRIFRALHIDFFFQMASLRRPNTVEASLTRLIKSLAPWYYASQEYEFFYVLYFFPVDDYSLVARRDNFTFGAVYFHTPFLACIFEL